MKILIYADPNKHGTEQFETIRTQVAYPKQIAKTHDAFKKTFAQCLSGETIVVFFINDDADMTLLEGMGENLVDTKLLLNVTGEDTALQARAYKMNPRIVTGIHDKPELLPMTVEGIARDMTGINR